MIIDFYKLLLQLIPLSLRNGLGRIAEAVYKPLTTLYAAIQAYQRDIRLQAMSTCQVMYLETMLNYRLLGSFVRTIYITDGDGLTADFVINVPPTATVEYNRLYALVDKYRLYGKRFTVGQAVLTYEFEWTGLVCEQSAQTFTFEWTGLVCEQVWQQYECTIGIYIDEEYHPNQHLVLASTTVTSNVQALVVYTWGNPADANESTAWITIPSGSGGSGWIDNPIIPGIDLTSIIVVQVNPTEDEYSNYYPEN
jgi:hypothetical protein